MIRNYLMIGFSAAALALSGCNQQERSPTRPEATAAVEGLPADPASIARPSPLPDVAGCYALTVDKPGPKGSRQDTLFRGRLRITQSGRNLKATLDWGEGRKEKANGRIGNDGVIGFESGDFSLKGHPDSSGFWGFFNDSSRGISGTLRLDAASCNAPIPPDTIVTASPGQRVCYAFTEIHFDPADTLQGTLALEQRFGESGIDVYLRLDRFGFFTAQTIYSAGMLGDESWVGFRIAPPPGMFGSLPVQEISYDLHLLPTGASSSPIMETLPAPGSVGTWRGQSRACLESDFRK